MTALVLRQVYPALGSKQAPAANTGVMKLDEPRGRFNPVIPEDVEVIRRLVVEDDAEFFIDFAQRTLAAAVALDAPIEVARRLSTKTLIPHFGGCEQVRRKFIREYNGTGLRRVLRSLSGASINASAARDLLASILEDALIATSSHFMPAGQNIATLRDEDEFILECAIAERLPRVYDENAHALAVEIVADLKAALGKSSALAIDDGAVVMNGQNIQFVSVGDSPRAFGGVQ